MTTVLFVVLPVLIAVGAALIAVYIMQQRMELQLARERQALGEARAALQDQRHTLDELDRLRQEAAQRKTLGDFLKDLRVEQRHFVREQKMLFATRKCLVVQERLYYRHIPLCNWVEHEAPIEEGVNLDDLAKTLIVFTPDLLGAAQDVQSSNGSSAPKVPDTAAQAQR